MKLVIASNNAKKRQEIAAILKSQGFTLVPVDETIAVEVVEDGDTFAANAEKKARAFATANGCAAVADDSGLCVDALDGAPGLYSARFAGDHGDDAANNALLLQKLQGVSDRQAHFCCHIALILDDGRLVTADGQVAGKILDQMDGTEGFGYDPLFYCDDLDKTFARADHREKARVSHRGRALQQLQQQLKRGVSHD
ncbi:MAG: RdgB/HAM1 family non-canonical purine NTP pyrophosphatase [Mariprofundaceae bacterium]|nr:RdgB/HAM1 family non-canonical purine NTP pyrophosphatase [Mariprofundaceae bacterium]